MGQFSEKEIEKIIKDHWDWLNTSGKKGAKADLSGADMSGAILGSVALRKARLNGTNLYKAFLYGADLRSANLSKANLSKANLSEANLYIADLRGANLRGANLRGGDMSRANLIGAKLHGANFGGANLSAANLYGVDLRGDKLNGVDLHGADLTRAVLRETSFRGADLRGAHLTEADLCGADLRGAHLTEADLCGADLRGADLRGASLFEADFESARFNKTRAARREDLLKAKNIESFEGFVFDSEEERKIKEEREERNQRAHRIFISGETGYLTFLLPDSYGPVQVGKVLFTFSFIYEGVRLALTSSFEDMDDLFRRSMAPEIFGTNEDEYRLRIESIVAGSMFGKLPGPKELVEATGEVPRVIEKYKSIRSKEQLRREQAIDLEEKETSLMANKQMLVKNQLELVARTQEMDTRREQALLDKAAKLSDLANKDGMPDDLVEGIQAVIKATVGELDRAEDRAKIIVEVVKRGTAQLGVMRDNLGGGEFKAGEHNLLPGPSEDDDEIIEADGYETSRETTEEDE